MVLRGTDADAQYEDETFGAYKERINQRIDMSRYIEIEVNDIDDVINLMDNDLITFPRARELMTRLKPEKLNLTRHQLKALLREGLITTDELNLIVDKVNVLKKK